MAAGSLPLYLPRTRIVAITGEREKERVSCLKYTTTLGVIVSK
jgi:hypothetical protein